MEFSIVFKKLAKAVSKYTLTGFNFHFKKNGWFFKCFENYVREETGGCHDGGKGKSVVKAI